MRKEPLHTTTGTIYIKKRPKPKLCEICHKRPPKDWHHPPGASPENGMWLCKQCHIKTIGFESMEECKIYKERKRELGI